MPKLRRVSGEEAIRALERLGFRQVRQRGSHVILKKETAQGAIGCVVPLHRELAIALCTVYCNKPRSGRTSFWRSSSIADRLLALSPRRQRLPSLR